MRKKQAEHNEGLCKILYKNGKYNDWVLTTAFYSALHYVQHKIFMSHFEWNKKKYKAFELYFKDFSRNHPTIGKHSATLSLVYEKIPIIYAKYRWLKDECHTARYKNYNISDSYAELSMKYLEEIKIECM